MATQLARPAQWAGLQAPSSSLQAAPGPRNVRHTSPAYRRPTTRRRAACAVSRRPPPPPPELPPPDAAPDAVAQWAGARFLEAARSNLTKACLLLALEEEAAAQAAYLDAEGLGQNNVAALRGCACCCLVLLLQKCRPATACQLLHSQQMPHRCNPL